MPISIRPKNAGRQNRGFTLMELMVTLAIAAIVLSIAVPNFNTFQRNNRLTGAANDLLGAIQVARTEAIKRQVPVSVCSSNNPTVAGATCSGGDFTGWITFLDPDSNCLRSGATEMLAANLLRSGGPIDSQVLVGSSGVCISFAPTGFRQPALVTGQPLAQATLFYDSRGCGLQPGTNLSLVREIEVDTTGRSRITRVPADITASGVACP